MHSIQRSQILQDSDRSKTEEQFQDFLETDYGRREGDGESIEQLSELMTKSAGHLIVFRTGLIMLFCLTLQRILYLLQVTVVTILQVTGDSFTGTCDDKYRGAVTTLQGQQIKGDNCHSGRTVTQLENGHCIAISSGTVSGDHELVGSMSALTSDFPRIANL
ncbi:hypothetical protein Tco_0542329 [Tanacetum coccineum]